MRKAGAVLLVISTFFLISFYYLSTPRFLTFSDGAKFADIARNIVEGKGYGSNFSFFTKPKSATLSTGIFSARWVPPLMPLAMLASFKLFGVSDLAVILTSAAFYLGLVLFTFVLGEKLFGKLVGFLAGLAVAANISFLDYATSGASEVLLTFEILLTIYLFLQQKKWANIAGFFGLAILYFTRPQAPIYIAAIWLFFLLINFRKKRSFIKMSVLTLVFAVLIEMLLRKFSGKYFLQSITKRGAIATYDYSSLSAGNTALRGGIDWREIDVYANLITVFKKTFYNLYNFYKLLPQIISPYMFALFLIGLFKWGKSRVENSLKIATIFMIALTFLATALTIPFFRYLHPVIPLVYLFATATLVWIVEKMVKKRWIVWVSTLLILFFVVGQALGVIFLDSRFEAARTNKGKPPVYVVLSQALKENTNPDDVVITNLDTWGSWYGERKTVWFPLEPNQLEIDGEVPFDAIYLTSYLIDDENYYMGEEWRDIFENPESHSNKFINQNYEFEGIYNVSAEDIYERQSSKAVLLVKKNTSWAGVVY